MYRVQDMLRKLVLTAIPLTLPDTGIKVALGVLWVVLSLAFYELKRPFINDDLTVIMCVTQYELFLTLFAGLLLTFKASSLCAPSAPPPLMSLSPGDRRQQCYELGVRSSPDN